MTYQGTFKRGLDILLASTLLVLSAPVLGFAGLAVALGSRGGVIFRQERVGRHGVHFHVYKLRTLGSDTNRDYDDLSAVELSVTPQGRVLRRTKVDELPQLYNVLKGDMSLVGPRPCPPGLLKSMPDWAHERFGVRPGLTGLAQVSGNTTLNWESRWRYDVEYVRGVSLRRDVAILAKTILIPLLGERIYRRHA